MRSRKAKKSVLAVLLVFSMLASFGTAAFAATDTVVAEAQAGQTVTETAVSVTIVDTSAAPSNPTGTVAHAEGDAASASVTVDQSVSVTSTNDETPMAMGTFADASGADASASVTIGQDLSVTNEVSRALDINANASNGAETAVAVSGNASAEGEHSSSVLSANAGSDGDVTVSIGGNATSIAEDNGSGIFARAEGDGSSIDVTVEGGLDVSGDFVNAVAAFANKDPDGGNGASAASGDSSVDITVKKDIGVVAEEFGEAVGTGATDGGKTNVEVGGEINMLVENTANAVTVDAKEGKSSVTVGGGIAAVSESGHASDIFARAEGKDASAIVEVGGDLKASGDSASGITAFANFEIAENGNAGTQASIDDAMTYVLVKGDVEIGSDGGFAQGVGAHAKNNGEAIVDISGKTDVEANAKATGFSASADDAYVEVDTDKDLTVTSETADALGAKASAVNDGYTQTTVGGSLSVEAEKDATGISVSADSSDAWAVAGKDLTVESRAENAQGVRANAVNEAEVYVEVGGKTTVESGKDDDSPNRATAFTLDANAGGIAGFMAGGEISVKAEDQANGVLARAGGDDSKISAEALGSIDVSGGSANGVIVAVNSEPDGYNNPDAETSGKAYAGVTVGGNITVAAAEGEGKGIDFDASADGEAEIEVSGSIDVKAKGAADGIVGRSDGASVDVTAGKNVVAESETAEAYAIYVHAENQGEAEVIIQDGDVTAKGAAFAAGLSGWTEQGSEAQIDVSGSITAKAAGSEDEPEPLAVGIQALADGKDSEILITVTGDVYAESAFLASGVSADAVSEGYTQVGIARDVTVKGNIAIGLDVSPAEQPAEVGGKVVIEVGGKTLVTGEEGADGIRIIGLSDGSDISIETSGVVAESAEGEATGVGAIGGKDGQISVTVGGNGITAAGGEESEGIAAATMGADIDITVFGAVSAQTGIALFGDLSAMDASLPEMYGFDEQAHEGTIGVFVDDDVTGEKYGLLAAGAQLSEAVMDVVVNGTLSGGEASVLIDEENLTEDNLKLTVWQIELNEAGNAAEVDLAEDASEEEKEAAAERAEEFEKSFMYIIRLEQPAAGATLSLDGTEKSHGYDTAKEDEKVILKVNVSSGYYLTGAYNGVGQKVELLKDENGDFYVIVPKGGGVYLTAAVGKYEEESSSTPVYTEIVPGKVTNNTVSTVPGYQAEIDAVTTEALKQELLSAADQQAVRFGSNVIVTVELKDASETVLPAVKQEIEEAAAEEVIAQWIDLEVSYQVAGHQRVKLEKATAKVRMSLNIPEELRALASSGAVFEMLCVAGGKIVRIPTVYDPFTGRLSFLTDIFGIFALVYTPAAV